MESLIPRIRNDKKNVNMTENEHQKVKIIFPFLLKRNLVLLIFIFDCFEVFYWEIVF